MVRPGRSSAATMVDVLRQRGESQSTKPAYTFLVDGERQEVTWTCGDLDRQARAIAAILRGEGLAGERALLLYPPGLSFVSSLFGCFYAGVTAVPSDLPRPRRPLTRLESIARDSRPAVILTTAALLPELQARFEGHPFIGGLRLIATDKLADDAVTEPVAVSPDQLAVIQYTSGSTSQPKGVVLSHANLVASSTQIARAFDHNAASCGVIWLPMYHDMGLIGGVLQPLFAEGPVVLMSPIHVVQRPLLWLQAISRYRATTSGGPNFMYDRCIDSISEEELDSLNLRSWQVAFNGAEPIQPRTVQRFAERFARCGFRREAFFPCYGLAEATLLVSGGPKSAGPIIQRFDKRALELELTALPARDGAPVTQLVGSGRAGSDIEIKIVDPDARAVCESGRVGEIWVSGPNVAQGYWSLPELTTEVFQASLGDDRRYLRTGDLGFVWRDQLFVVGRSKDLLIIDGRNHYPQDIEQTVERCHPAFRGLGGAAFALQSDGSERLAVVHECWQDVDTDEAIRAIRQSVSNEHEVSVSRVTLVKIGRVPRTSSGKVQRSRCRDLLLADELAVVAQWQATVRASPSAAPDRSAVEGCVSEGASSAPQRDRVSAEDVQEWFVAELERRLPALDEPIDIQAPFAAFGLTSRDAVEIAGQLEAFLGRRLSPTLMYEHPTIEAVSRALGQWPAAAIAPAAVATRKPEAGEAIAIVGIACRLPGASSAGSFWRLLAEGRDAIREVPADRWDTASTTYRSLVDGHDPEGSCLRWGGFLERIDAFDAKFFAIAQREAMYIDPQQRLLLEVAWDALEDAGQTLEALRGSPTGVFVGISTSDYAQLCLQQAPDLEPYWSTGNASSIAANRLSYFLDLKGPSLAVDTACSSSLVATHLACNSLRSAECDLALAGGVNVILTPTVSTSFAQAGGLAPDGRCKAFDARANGIVRSEGVGVVVLKRLSEALADGDQIYAVIRGSAVNQDGRTNGITAPLQSSQEAVLREAYRNAGISPGAVQYVEAHGAGSALGDVIEANALRSVLSQGRPPGHKCALGSVKTNIGHLEAAAGVAGLIKVALALRHGWLPPSLHFVEPNPGIPFADMPFAIQTEYAPWPASDGRRLAGISGFGFGGTNAHLVLESAPGGVGTTTNGARPHDETDATTVRSAYVLPLSAASSQAVRSAAASLSGALRGELASAPLADVCYAASVRRTHHRERAAICFRTRDELVERLAALSRGERCRHVETGVAPPGRAAKLAFVFSGHGGQWSRMGRRLYTHDPVFRARIAECDELLSAMGGWSIREELLADEPRSHLSGTDIVHLEINQVTQFALQVAVADVWRAWGIQPDAVVGHSVGEAAAAYVAGALALPDALRVVVCRSRLLSEAAKDVSGDQGMAAVRVSAAEAEALLRDYEGQVVISAYNSPKYTVLSGRLSALDELIRSLRKRKIGGRLMQVPGAGHTPHIEPLRTQLEDMLSGLRPTSGSVAVYSTVTGSLISGSELDARYWGSNLVQTVNFAPAVERLSENGFDAFIELGPAPLLVAAINQCLEHHDRGGVAVPSLRVREDDFETMYSALGALYAIGRPVNWRGIYPSSQRWVSLPSYPWQRESYWLGSPKLDSAGSTPFRADGRAPAGHPLLAQGVELAEPSGTRVWQARVDLGRLPFLNDYRIDDTVSLPAAVYLDAAIAAIVDSCGAGPWILADVVLPSALQVSAASGRLIQATCTRAGGGEGRLQLHGRADSDEPWRRDAGCEFRRFSAAPRRSGDDPSPLHAARERCADETDAQQFYASRAECGNVVGPAFRALQQIWHGRREAVGRLRVREPASRRNEQFAIHPAVIDAGLQLIAVARGDATQWLCVPTLVEAVRVWRSPSPDSSLWAHASVRPTSTADDLTVADVAVWDDDGEPVLEMNGVHVEPLRCSAISAGMQDPREWLYEVRWLPAPLPRAEASSERSAAGTWVLFADDQGLSTEIKKLLVARGQTCIVVNPGPTYRQSGVHEFEVDPLHADQWRRLFDEIGAVGVPPVRGVAQLWGCRTASAQTSRRTLEVAEDLLMVGTLGLIQAFDHANFSTAPRLWLVTKRAQVIPGDQWRVSLEQAALWGLGRTLQREHPSWRCTLVDLSADDAREAGALCEEFLDDDAEDQLALRAGDRYVARLMRPSPNQDFFSQRPAAGETMSFALHVRQRAAGPVLALQGRSRRAPGPGEVEIEVHAAKVSGAEISAARSRLDRGRTPTWFGCAAAGRVLRVGAEVRGFDAGDEVLAVGAGSAASHLTTHAALVLRRPSTLTPDAVTAAVFGLVVARHGLERLGRLAPGERVLIHGASTSVGQAALELALRARAEIVVTSADPQVVETLRGRANVRCLDGEPGSLTEQVLAATNGEGVDLILDCRVGGSQPVATRSLRPFGRLVEIVEPGNRPHGHIAAEDATRNVACFAIDPVELFVQRPGYCCSLLRDMVEPLELGELALLPFETMPVSRVVGALSPVAEIATGKNLVLLMSDRDAVVAPAEASVRLSGDATYLITGGLGGLGLYLAEWMLECGARHLVLMSRRTASPEIEAHLQHLRAKGAEIHHAQADVTNRDDLDVALRQVAERMPPLRGVLHCAATLDDVVLTQMRPTQLKAVLASKVQGTWNLHELTLGMPLDFFVMFSSGAALIGPPGSANYAAANAFLDAMAVYRRQSGLKALAVGWGLWGDAGMVKGTTQQSRIKLSGFRTMPATTGARILGQLLQTDIGHLVVMPVDWAQLRRVARATTRTPFLEKVFAEVASETGPDFATTDILTTLRSTDEGARERVLVEFLRNQLSVTLGTSPEKIPFDQPLLSLGVDSLLALEMKNRVEAELHVSLRIVELLQGPTLETLAGSLMTQINLAFAQADAGLATASVDERTIHGRVGVGESAQAVLERIDELADADLDALYKQMLTEDEGHS